MLPPHNLLQTMWKNTCYITRISMESWGNPSTTITGYLFAVHWGYRLQIRGLGLWRWVQAGHGDHPPGAWRGSGASTDSVGLTPQASRAKRSKFLRWKIRRFWGNMLLTLCFDEWNRINKRACCVFLHGKIDIQKKHADGSWVLQEYTTIRHRIKTHQ